MKRLLTLIGLLAALTAPAAETITLEWDGSPDTNEVTGYILYYGGASNDYTNATHTTTKDVFTVDVTLSPGTFYFVVTARDASGLESLPSNEISYTVKPGKPRQLRIVVQTSTNMTGWIDGPSMLIPIPEPVAGQEFFRSRLALE